MTNWTIRYKLTLAILVCISVSCKVSDEVYDVAAIDEAPHVDETQSSEKTAQKNEKVEESHSVAEPAIPSPVEELGHIQRLFDRAELAVKAELGGYGRGWLGNLSRTGPHCDIVFYVFERELRRIAPNSKFYHYQPVQIFSAGSLPMDIAAHIYMGVARKSDRAISKSDLVFIYDPWRWGHVKPGSPRNNPNRVDQINPFIF